MQQTKEEEKKKINPALNATNRWSLNTNAQLTFGAYASFFIFYTKIYFIMMLRRIKPQQNTPNLWFYVGKIYEKGKNQRKIICQLSQNGHASI